MSDPRLDRPLWRGRTNVDAYTIAWVEHAEQIVRNRWPDIAHEWVITKGSYQGTSGTDVSSTTHALGGVVDTSECGHPECLLAGRLAGGFIWRRTPQQDPDWPFHRHGGPLGHPLQDPVLHNQEFAYLAGFNGLGHLGRGGPDDGPRPNPIPQPIWPWPEEDDMPLWSEWPQDEKDTFLADVAKAVWNFTVNNAGTKAKAAIEAAGRAAKKALGES